MNPYLARHVGIIEFPSDIHLIILSASSSTKPSLDGTQSSSVEESPLSPHSQTQSTAFLPLHLSPRRPSHIAFSCLSPPSRSCLLSSRSYLLSSHLIRVKIYIGSKQMHDEVNQWSRPVMDRADSGTHLDNPSWNLPSNSSIWKHLDIYFGKSTDLEIW